MVVFVRPDRPLEPARPRTLARYRASSYCKRALAIREKIPEATPHGVASGERVNGGVGALFGLRVGWCD